MAGFKIRPHTAPVPTELREQKDFFLWVLQKMIDAALEQKTTSLAAIGQWADTRQWKNVRRQDLPVRPPVPYGVELAHSPYRYIYHVPNGGAGRNRGNLSAEGYSKGFPDIPVDWPMKMRILGPVTGPDAWPYGITFASQRIVLADEGDDDPGTKFDYRVIFPFLRIELKRLKGGSLSPDQKIWKQRIERVGGIWRRANGAKDAIEITEGYLGGKLKEMGGTI